MSTPTSKFPIDSNVPPTEVFPVLAAIVNLSVFNVKFPKISKLPVVPFISTFPLVALTVKTSVLIAKFPKCATAPVVPFAVNLSVFTEKFPPLLKKLVVAKLPVTVNAVPDSAIIESAIVPVEAHFAILPAVPVPSTSV